MTGVGQLLADSRLSAKLTANRRRYAHLPPVADSRQVTRRRILKAKKVLQAERKAKAIWGEA